MRTVLPGALRFAIVLLMAAVLVGAAGVAQGQTPSASGTILTIAGGGADAGENVPALSASIHPIGLAFGADGTLYFSDGGNFRVRAIDPLTGLVTTVAGTGVSGNGGNGPATSTPITGAVGIAVDPSGRLLLTDVNSHRLRRVDFGADTLEVVAGVGTPFFGFAGDGGPATAARLFTPSGVAVDSAGNILIADTGNRRIRRVDAVTGVITTVAGSGMKQAMARPVTAAPRWPRGFSDRPASWSTRTTICSSSLVR